MREGGVLLIDGVTGILADAGVEDDTIQQILTMLAEAQGQVERGSGMRMVPAASLGGSATAAELAHHAGKAHHHVVAAMTQMVAGLQGYHDSVEHFRKSVHETDSTVGSDLNRRAAAAASIVAPSLRLAESCTQQADFAADSSCEVASEGEG